MQPFLIFGMTASLAAMGELAGHERRGSLQWPSRSALLGLMGAALGIRRDGDFKALDALNLAVAVFDEGAPLRDYHTVETVPSAAAKYPNSRPEALRVAQGRTNTTITLRDYRVGPVFGVVAWGEISMLEAVARALREPAYTLYLGRKSCPLSAPPGAKVVQAETPEAALADLALPPWRIAGGPLRAHTLVLDADEGEVVHDIPLNRAQWHFAPRTVELRPVDIVVGAAQ
nr:type I-E CRISPR-associated protein Cas5/CasD [Thioclava sp.]